jgi:hypothetical protein
MSRGDRLALLSSLFILIIIAVFAYLVTILISSLGSRFIILALILGSIVALFFFFLEVFGLILAIVMLTEYIHRYAVIRERREIKRLMSRYQILTRRNRFNRGIYSYRPQPKIRHQRENNSANNGC